MDTEEERVRPFTSGDEIVEVLAFHRDVYETLNDYEALLPWNLTLQMLVSNLSSAGA